MSSKTLKGTRRADSGFTLIELLVVVLIIGILAAIAVPQYFAVIEKGHVAEATACIDPIKSSMLRYQLSSGSYTDALDVTQPPGGPVAANPLDTACQGMKYFGGRTFGSPTTYTITMTRNGTSYSTTSGAGSPNYTVSFVHTDGPPSTNAWGGNVPVSWLPQ